MMKPLIAAVVAAAMMLSSASAKTWECKINEKHACNPEKGCSANTLGVTNYINFERKTYARCDRAGCDTYDAQFSQSGSFHNIAVADRVMFAKVWPNHHSQSAFWPYTSTSGKFMEVVTLGSTVLVSYGICTPHSEIGTAN